MPRLHAPTIAELIGQVDDYHPSPLEEFIVRFNFQIGLLQRGTFAAIVGAFTQLGLDIEVTNFGGLLVRNVFVVASGRWQTIRWFLLAMEDMSE